MLPPEKEQAASPIELLAQSIPAQKDKVGLLVTKELDKAIARCKDKVERISRDCRRRNRRFRDLSFDLEEDRERCLHGLATPPSQRFSPADVLRVGQIFEKPQFYIDGATSGDIVQGELGDCWFLSALATCTCYPELIEKVCVARDEQVGVYGFIFYRDGGWVDVVIDDLLYVSVPKYESLTQKERNLYHNDKYLYNQTARKGGKTLYFARSGAENETWVALIEKAYAKLHGDYAALLGGAAAEALEDLTGGVSTLIHMNDILAPEEFWQNELLKANEDRLFGCYLSGLEVPVDSENGLPTVNGLIVGHAYSVLRALEHNGHRFVRIRNPWGSSEWTGPWSDGSKEWNAEWLAALPALGHAFGDDGEFLMSYEDFLSTFWVVHRTKIFDPSWTLSSHWLEVENRKFPAVWSFGDVSFTFNMPKPSPAIIVLTQLDTRYFRELASWTKWSFDFALFKHGEKEPLAVSHHAAIWTRSVNVELELEPGEYVVHVRFDRRVEKEKNWIAENINSWNPRKMIRVLTECITAQTIAANFNPNDWGNHRLPLPLERFAGYDLAELEIRAMEDAIRNNEPEPEPQPRLEENGSIGNEMSNGAEDDDANDNDGSADPALGQSGDDGVIVQVEDEDPTEGPVAVEVEGNGSTEEGVPQERDLHQTDGDPDVIKRKTLDVPDNAGQEGLSTNTIEGMGLAAESLLIEREDHGATKAKAGNEQDIPVLQQPLRRSHRVAPRSGPIHDGVRCDGCNEMPIVGLAYKCLEPSCPDFDLCESCYIDAYTTPVHKDGHRMVPLRPGDRIKLRDNVLEDVDTVTVGLKVFTKDCKDPPVTVRGQLRHGRIISWKRPEDD